MLKKRLLTLTLSILFVWSTCCLNVSATNSINETPIQKILIDVQSLEPSIDLSNAEIVPLSSCISSYSERSQDSAIRILSEENGMVKHELLIPSKIDKDGNLVNSFASFPIDSGEDLHFNNLVDIVVHISCYYELNFTNMTFVYRPTGFTFRWTSSISNISVDYIDISYQYRGQLVDFETAKTINPYGYQYCDNKTFYVPIKDRVYYNWDNMLERPYGITCTNGDYGAVCFFTIDYTANGRTFEESRNELVFPHI